MKDCPSGELKQEVFKSEAKWLTLFWNSIVRIWGVLMRCSHGDCINYNFGVSFVCICVHLDI